MRRDGEQWPAGIGGAIAETGTVEDSPATAAFREEPPSRLGELRSLADVLARAIADHPTPSLEADEARWRAEELVDALRDGRPSPPRVKSRWMRLAPLVRELNLEPLGSTIDELIAKVL